MRREERAAAQLVDVQQRVRLRQQAEGDDTAAKEGLAFWLREIGACDRRPTRRVAEYSRGQLRHDMVAAGVLPDGHARWAVTGIVQTRGAGHRREALVRWRGFDVAAGLPWPDSWVTVRWLTADLRSEWFSRARSAQAIAAEERARARDATHFARETFVASDVADPEAARKEGKRRTCPRLAGREPGPGLQ